ncbi:MAG TPA: hypothetical protein VN929_04810 [Burkholderiales bacterium]|nr:hypothetical protein [Burkholderiales bacterium]
MRAYVQITGVIFGIVALTHVARLVFGWSAEVAGSAVPLWISWVAIVVAGALCIWAFRLAASKTS